MDKYCTILKSEFVMLDYYVRLRVVDNIIILLCSSVVVFGVNSGSVDLIG